MQEQNSKKPQPCEHCGAPVDQPRNRVKRFCSDGCKWNNLRSLGRAGRPGCEWVTKKCRNCGMEFECNPSTAKKVESCSLKCRDQWYKKHPRDLGGHKGKELCLACGKKYECSPSYVGKRKFCSWECRVPYMKAHEMMRPKGRADFECKECGTSCRTNAYAANKRQFCSKQCHDRFNKRTGIRRKVRLTHRCCWCKASFQRLACMSRESKRLFCSHHCHGAYAARYSQNRVSKVETRFFDLLEAAGFPVVRQKRVKHFVVDAVAKHTNVAIEFDGSYWHSLPRIIEKDGRKEIAIAWAGYKLIRVKEDDFYTDPDGTVLSVIVQASKL